MKTIRSGRDAEVGDLVKACLAPFTDKKLGVAIGHTSSPDALLVLWQDGRVIPVMVGMLEVV